MTPPGFEPRSKEPESSILSIKLWGRYLSCKCNNILLMAPLKLKFPCPFLSSEYLDFPKIVDAISNGRNIFVSQNFTTNELCDHRCRDHRNLSCQREDNRNCHFYLQWHCNHRFFLFAGKPRMQYSLEYYQTDGYHQRNG